MGSEPGDGRGLPVPSLAEKSQPADAEVPPRHPRGRRRGRSAPTRASARAAANPLGVGGVGGAAVPTTPASSPPTRDSTPCLEPTLPVGRRSFSGHGAVERSGTPGPAAVPASYEARLTVGDWSATVPFEVRPDPLSGPTTQEDRVAQFRFLIDGARQALTEMHTRDRQDPQRARSQIRGARSSAASGKPDADTRPSIACGGEAARSTSRASKPTLYQTKNRSRQDPLNFPDPAQRQAGRRAVERGGR